MTTIKIALLNIIRIPMRTVLFSLIAFTVIFIGCFCFNTANVSDNAIRALDDSYPFTATIISKNIPSSDGSFGRAGSLNLDTLSLLQNSKSIATYNFEILAGQLAEDEIVSTLPDNTILTKEPAAELSGIQYPVVAVNELYLEQEFTDGSYYITDGSPFTDADIYGGNRAIIISETIAQKYGFGIGDTVNYKIKNSDCYRSCVVRGIFAESFDRPVAAAYIPLSDYFSDAATVLQGLSRADSSKYYERSLDSVNRIDFLLKSKQSVSEFMYDAKKAGVDLSKYEIIINDRAYNTAAYGISEIRTISLFVLVLTVAAGCIILYAIIAFYRRTRAKEILILHNLGMRYVQINLIYFFEYAFLIAAAAILAVSIGTVSSNLVVEYLNDTYIAELENYANQKEPASDTVGSFRSSALTYPVRMSFHKDGEVDKLPFVTWKLNKDEDHPAVRYEQFYDADKQRQIIVRGVEDQDLHSGSGDEILYDSDRIGGYEFPCSVPQNSEYSVGDSIVIYRISDSYYSAMQVDAHQNCRYSKPYMAYVVLRVKKITDSENIEVNYDDLTVICTYLGISSSVYRNIRYDSVNPFCADNIEQ